jgi:hypothetical protein
MNGSSIIILQSTGSQVQSNLIVAQSSVDYPTNSSNQKKKRTQRWLKGFPDGVVEEGERVFAFDLYGYRTGGQHIRAHTTTSQQLAEEASKSRGKGPLKT